MNTHLFRFAEVHLEICENCATVDLSMTLPGARVILQFSTIDIAAQFGRDIINQCRILHRVNEMNITTSKGIK